jgi:hypothetical protein
MLAQERSLASRTPVHLQLQNQKLDFLDILSSITRLLTAALHLCPGLLVFRTGSIRGVIETSRAMPMNGHSHRGGIAKFITEGLR